MTAMPVVTNEPIQLSYFVSDITSAIATYNRLRWWRSRTGADGTYEAATASALAPATMLGSSLTPHTLNGKEFKFKVDGTTEVSVVFADADPVTTAQVVAAIAAETALVTAADEDGLLRLTTVSTGSAASIEILDGDANAALGFVEGDGAVGQDLDTTLVAGTHEYFYTDQNSDEEFWYRVEFFHSVTGDTTGQGVPFPADQAQQIPRSSTIVCYVQLADMRGKAIIDRKVIIANGPSPNLVDASGQLWGVFRQYEEMRTDRNGYAEIRLLRGITVDVHIEGTGFTRRITIPTTGDAVNLLDPDLQAEDEFGIQQQNVNFAFRMS